MIKYVIVPLVSAALQSEFDTNSTYITDQPGSDLVKFTNIGDYGCWCQAIVAAEPLRGQALDDVDKECRKWVSCRHKITTGSKCAETSPEMFYSIKEVKNYRNQGTTYDCDDSKNSVCTNAYCGCNVSLRNNLVKLLDGKTELAKENLFLVNSQCQPSINWDKL